VKQHWPGLLARISAILGVLAFAPAVVAQNATPAASTEGLSLAASGLESPRGFAWGADGTLYVAQADITSTQPAADATPVANGSPFAGGLNGNVARIADGCATTFQGVLPSSGGHGDIDLGPSDLAIVNGVVYVLDEGGGAANGNPLTPDGIYSIDGSGSAILVADIGTWIKDNPVSKPPQQPNPDGDPFAMVAANGSLWVTENNGGQLLNVTLDGKISRVVDFSSAGTVPTGLTVAADNSLVVGTLTSGSYAEGSASVVTVSTTGDVAEVWTGLTAVTAVAVDASGTLYALQTGTGGTTQLSSVASNTGSVVRQTGKSTSAEVATGFDVPLFMAFGPDQGLYVSSPAFSITDQAGSIVRLDLSEGTLMTMSDELLANSPCVTAPTPTAEPTTGAATPSSSPAAGTTTPAASGPAVDIHNFAFNPGSLSVAVGDTVTWTNTDTVAHTVTSRDGTFNSGTLEPGKTFTFTFTKAGSFDYVCSFHPNMTGTIVVK
jgi:plastocyanin